MADKETQAMLIGYARTSTLEQVAGLESQRASLTAIGCERVYEEQIVRRQSFWNQKRRELRECSAHRVGLIMLRVDCDASVALRMSSV